MAKWWNSKRGVRPGGEEKRRRTARVQDAAFAGREGRVVQVWWRAMVLRGLGPMKNEPAYIGCYVRGWLAVD